MVKAKFTLSVDPNVVEDAKSQFDNVSKRVEELLQAELDISQIDDEDRINEKIDSLTKELEELQEEKEGIEKDIEDVESQISTAKATLKRLQREKEEESDALAGAMKRIKKNIDEGEYLEASDIHHGNVEMTGKSREELWKMATEEDDV